jgi:hypothetical protein
MADRKEWREKGGLANASNEKIVKWNLRLFLQK